MYKIAEEKKLFADIVFSIVNIECNICILTVFIFHAKSVTIYNHHKSHKIKVLQSLYLFRSSHTTLFSLFFTVSVVNAISKAKCMNT